MPGGVMRIALYSSTARKPLGLVKSYLAAEGLNSANSLLAARQHILLQSGAP